MSLGRLLTAGRSLVGGSNSGHQYRMTDPKAMPKFGSAKNPLRSKASRERLSTETGRAVVASAAMSAPAGIATDVPLAVKRPEGRAPVTPVAAPTPAAASPALAKQGWLRARGARFFAWLSRPRAAAAKPAVPRFEALPIQGELALDRIRVVRNDLSDADLEVVSRTPVAPAKGSASPIEQSQPELMAITAAASAPAQKTGAARAAWHRAGQLLGAVKS